jgi:hypothetical protein
MGTCGWRRYRLDLDVCGCGLLHPEIRSGRAHVWIIIALTIPRSFEAIAQQVLILSLQITISSMKATSILNRAVLDKTTEGIDA